MAAEIDAEADLVKDIQSKIRQAASHLHEAELWRRSGEESLQSGQDKIEHAQELRAKGEKLTEWVATQPRSLRNAAAARCATALKQTRVSPPNTAMPQQQQ